MGSGLRMKDLPDGDPESATWMNGDEYPSKTKAGPCVSGNWHGGKFIMRDRGCPRRSKAVDYMEQGQRRESLIKAYLACTLFGKKLTLIVACNSGTARSCRFRIFTDGQAGLHFKFIKCSSFRFVSREARDQRRRSKGNNYCNWFISPIGNY